MKIENFTPFTGKHCETTATGSLLSQLGIHLSEPMLFGLGEGLGFLIWNMKIMDFPFIGGRVKTDLLTQNLCNNLKLKLEVNETASLKKAWKNIETPLSEGKAVGIKLDCYHLEYFSSKIHFAGHYVAMYGYDDEYAFLVDTAQQGKMVKTKLKNLALARSEKGPMSSKNLSYTIEKTSVPSDVNKVIKEAIYRNAIDYLNPPIKNFGYKGIIKTATEIKKWYKASENIKQEFQLSSALMEKAGTGGALFRNLYRDFLLESSERLKDTELKESYKDFQQIAKLWTNISELFHEIGETNNEQLVDQASSLFIDIADKEKAAMEKLRDVCKN